MRHHLPASPSFRRIGAAALFALAAALLAGCETTSAPSNPLSELAAYSSGAGARAQSGAPGRAEAAAPEKPKTRAQAAMDCWSVLEKSRAGASLEAKTDYVHACIGNKLGTTTAKPDGKPAAAPKRQRPEAKPAS